MANVSISEFTGKGPVAEGQRIAIRGAGRNPQNVTIDGTPRESTAFAHGTTHIRIACNAECRIRIGAAGGTNAVATDEMMPAGALEYRMAKEGDALFVLNSS